MHKQIFVNLPITDCRSPIADLAKSQAFFKALGCAFREHVHMSGMPQKG